MEMELILFIDDIDLYHSKVLGSFIFPILLCPTVKLSLILTIFILISTVLIQAPILSH